MPFYDRTALLRNTLLSFQHQYKDRNDYEVVIVEDYKNSQDISSLMQEFASSINILIVMSEEPEDGSVQYNPSKMFNTAADIASGEFLVITNPEVFHEENILAGFDEEFLDNEFTYVVCSCKSAIDCSGNYPNIKYTLDKWYEHTQHWNRKFHFCSAMKKSTYNSIGGFDEEYLRGIGYDDNDFINTLLFHHVPVVCRDDLIVVHQDHSREYGMSQNEYMRLYNANAKYFSMKWR